MAHEGYAVREAAEGATALAGASRRPLKDAIETTDIPVVTVGYDGPLAQPCRPQAFPDAVRRRGGAGRC